MHWMVCLVYFGPLHPDFYYGHIAFDKPSLESFLAGIKAHSARGSCKLQQAVEDVGGMIPCEMLRSTAQNVRKRAKACIVASGGHIELLVKLS